MDAFITLRQQAADKRDKAVCAARAEFRATLKQIEKLRETLGDAVPIPRSNGATTIINIIRQLMPRDKTFTLDDIVKLLGEADTSRTFNPVSVRLMICDLHKAGEVRKVCRTLGGIVFWAHPDCPHEHGPLESINIVDAATMVLEQRGPLSSAEIVVALKEIGYRPNADPRMLMRTLRYALKRNREKFDRDDESGKWSLAD